MRFFRLAAIFLGPISTYLIVRGLGRLQVERKSIPVEVELLAGNIEIVENDSDDFFEKWILPLANWFAEKFSGLQNIIMPKNLNIRLLHAGRPFNLSQNEAYGVQWVGAVASALGGIYLGLLTVGLLGAILASILLGIGGFFLFPLWLDSEADDRQREIGVDLMTTLDVLAISVKGGMGFDEALKQYVDNIDGPLQEELNKYLQEISVGLSREEALTNLMERNSSQDLRTFVGALIQGYQLGTPLADVLQKQAEEMRVRQLQLARELGAKAAPKIALVTGLLMAPAIACLVITIFGMDLAEKLGPALGIFGDGGGPLP